MKNVKEEDLLIQSIDKCLNKLNLTETENMDKQQQACLNGCMLKELKMIGEDGKLLPNGIEDFIKNIPAEYLKDQSELKADLNKIAPELREAKDACDAGKIANEAVKELFKTEIDTPDELEQ
ncbi:uncharacterized protein LOC129565881 isoform X3 [Sitodiplosis mosellana]|uniref:uncharacterized protein LOC129565881 isoform X3 n=1 Tax=Sitodiplosis mosellana TaxID=263140 RepID=UPI002444FCA3|nr:uncharacterized protein LOC129565881 isoform X3 [Sitodiplosis mosellana]